MKENRVRHSPMTTKQACSDKTHSRSKQEVNLQVRSKIAESRHSCDRDGAGDKYFYSRPQIEI